MFLEEHHSGKIELSAYGLKLEIDPSNLIRKSIDCEAHKMLDGAIEKILYDALREFKNSEGNTKENQDKLYTKEIHCNIIKKIALIERELINKLHSDCEDMDIPDDLIDVRDFVTSVWRYDTDYGFKPSTKYEPKENI